jgi:hypothetical protein
MYHVIGTGLTALLLYLLSYFLYRYNFYSKQIHKKLWNTILAAAFTLTALAGLFLALQINYKWNIPVIKSILKWHVEFGIGLSVKFLIFSITSPKEHLQKLIHTAVPATQMKQPGQTSD